MDERAIKTQKVEDRISTLPDGVICHILSFLLTKDAVCTSALSTRWRFLFVSVTVLRLYDFSGIIESQEVRGRKFTEFVNGLLNRHDLSDISSFDLSLSFGVYDISDVNSWISNAIRRNVRNINVMAHTPIISDGVRSLVSSLFTCKTLVDLYLFGEFDLSVPESVCLPNLKTCCLASFGIKFIDDGSAQRLFSSCPMLEKLNLVRCDMGSIENLELHIPSLKMVNIDVIHTDKILLNAPNLESFQCGGPSVFCKGVWKSIVRANIMIRKENEFSQENLSQLANNLIEVKYLSLCSQTTEASISTFSWTCSIFTLFDLIIFIVKSLFLFLLFFPMVKLLQQSRSLPTFNKLTHLELKAASKAGWNLLPTLLHRAPCLEVLVIHKGLNDDHIYDEITESLPLCLSRQLKVAMVYVSIEDQAEFKWIQLLLKIASVLKKLTVYPKPPKAVEDRLQWRDQIREELLAFPRISENCQVEIQDKNFLYGSVF